MDRLFYCLKSLLCGPSVPVGEHRSHRILRCRLDIIQIFS